MNLLKYAKLQTELRGKHHIRYLEDEYAKLWQMYGDLEDQRDRLRGALKEIRSLNSVNALILDIIETALMQEDRDES